MTRKKKAPKKRTPKKTQGRRAPPIEGRKIVQLVPAAPNWRALFLVVDDDQDEPPTPGDESVRYYQDIGCFALVHEKVDRETMQDILPCVPTDVGTLEPIDIAESPNYVGIVSPEDDESEIQEMIKELLDELEKMQEDDEGQDEDDED